jgi:multiple sugar transport system permease protein
MTKVKVKKENGFWERNRKSNGYLLKKTLMGWGLSLCRFILLFGMCFLILQPIFNKISISFMEERDLYNPIVISIPEHFSTHNYWLSAKLMVYDKAIVNSIIISLTIAVLQIAVCTLVGYGFARFEFPLKNFWFACVMLLILVPPQTISSALHLHFKFFDVFGIIKATTGTTLNLSGKVIPYYLMSATCMGLKNGLYIFMIRQFFRTVPYDLEEAAYVDGCGTLKTFFKIMLPQGVPIITSCFLFAFVWQWTDGFYSKLFLGTTKLLSTSLARLVDTLGAYMMRLLGETTSISVAYSNCILSTGTLMFILPLIVLYLFAQKAFVESISSSGIKM